MKKGLIFAEILLLALFSAVLLSCAVRREIQNENAAASGDTAEITSTKRVTTDRPTSPEVTTSGVITVRVVTSIIETPDGTVPVVVMQDPVTTEPVTTEPVITDISLPDPVDPNPGFISYYAVDNYGKTGSKTHVQEFADALLQNGYYALNSAAGETVPKSYLTFSILDVMNVTPRSVSDEVSDIELFSIYHYGSFHYLFLMKQGTIYRMPDPIFQVCMWDYDGNGTKDLVVSHVIGSGMCHYCVGVCDMTTMKMIPITAKLYEPEGEYQLEMIDGTLRIDGRPYSYENGHLNLPVFSAVDNGWIISFFYERNPAFGEKMILK